MLLRCFDVREVDGVQILTFKQRDHRSVNITEDNEIAVMALDLRAAVREGGRIAINFRPVKSLSSSALGKLILLDKWVKDSGGKLELFAIPADLYEIFVVTKLHKLFKIYDDEESALNAFASASSATRPGTEARRPV